MRDVVRVFGLVLFPALLYAVACGVINEELPSYEASSKVVEGDKAPDFTATTIDDRSVTLSAMQGDEVLLVLFSHTCPDCKSLLDDMQAAKAVFDELGVYVLLVARDGRDDVVAAYMSDNGYDFDVIADLEREIYNLYATMYVPRTYLIDADGDVVHTTIEYEATHVSDILSEAEGL